MTTASNQPALNGSASARRDAGVDAERLGARDHRLGGVDGPDAGELALLERLREPAGAAADLEHPPAAEVPEADERLVDLPPVVVDRAQLLVAGGAAVEPGRHASTAPPRPRAARAARRP